jgi:hypothetical protein
MPGASPPARPAGPSGCTPPRGFASVAPAWFEITGAWPEGRKDGNVSAKGKKRIPVSKITLLWVCPNKNCHEEAAQPLGEIAEAGTAICPECGDDMELKEYVEVDV